jgi:hypothetical protein
VFTLDIAWLITGGMAFAAVRNGNIEVHRQFTTVFVTVRVLNVMLIPETYGHPPSRSSFAIPVGIKEISTAYSNSILPISRLWKISLKGSGLDSRNRRSVSPDSCFP